MYICMYFSFLNAIYIKLSLPFTFQHLSTSVCHPKEVMWPRLVSSSKILTKTLSSNNFVTDFPTSPVTVLPKNNTTQSYKKRVSFLVVKSTWNVGGVAPTGDLKIDDLLDTQNTCCDIYVLGFQEVVPLTASNVLGLKKKKVSKKWNSLIRKTLIKKSRTMRSKVTKSKAESSDLKTEFRCLVSKRMVGLLISVWVRSDLHQLVRNTNVSCVGCGIMGCLGNKGSVSVRFLLHDTSFCFVCTHLASGGGEGDEQNRNSNVIEIFSRTSFPTTNGSIIHMPKRILDHDRVVLFGDLNYRISLPDKETRSLVNWKNWSTLIEYDQLRSELMDGHFLAWNEGTINFAPTYKYLPDSDEYFDKDYETKRAPAWCDRIIWTGEDIKQILYDRTESKLSDHRPVKAIFSTRC